MMLAMEIGMTKTIDNTSIKKKVSPKDILELEKALKYLQKTSMPGQRWQDLLGRSGEIND